MNIKFKRTRIEGEFYSDDYLDPLLRCLAFGIADFLWRMENKEMVITCICRTEDENKRLGGHPMSKHTMRPSRAMDIRSWNMDEGLLNALLLWLKRNFWPQFTYKAERRGRRGEHIHIQRNV